MGERDAFGREKGENTLADMGWSGSSSSGLPSQDAPPVERPASPDQPRVVTSTPSAMDAGEAAKIADAFRSAGAPQPVQVHVRRSRPGRVIGPLVLLAVIGAGIFGATAAINAGQSALDDFNSAVRDAVPTVVDEVPEVVPPAADEEDPEAAEPPADSGGGSLLRPAALRSALKKLPEGDLVMLRVSSDRINGQIKADDGLHIVTVSANGEVSDIKAPVNLPDLGGVKVNAAAPNRIARTAARRAKQKVSDIDYLVLISLPGGSATWQLYFKDGERYTANASGRKVQKAG